MSENLEVLFCDLCNSSIAEADIAQGRVTRLNDRTLGPCCVPPIPTDGPAVEPGGAIRAGAAAAASVTEPAGRGGSSSLNTVAGEATPSMSTVVLPTRAAAPSESRLLPAVLVLLVALAAATMFLDMRLGQELTTAKSEVSALASTLHDQEQRLTAMVQRLEGLAGAGDLDGLREGLRELGRAQADRDGLLTQRMNQHLVTVEGLGRRLDELAKGFPDPSDALVAVRDDLRLLKLGVEELLARPSLDSLPDNTAAVMGRGDEILAPADPEVALQLVKLSNADPGIRFVAVDELLRSGNPAALEHLLPMVNDEDAFVRRLTVEGLAAYKDATAVDALLGAMSDDEEIVRSTAYDAVQRLTGESIPFDPAGSRDARGAGLRRWQQWWDKARPTFGA